MALTFPEFVLCPLRYPPQCLFFSKFSPRISCNATSPSTEGVKEKRERRHDAMKRFLLKECGLSISHLPTVMSKDPSLFRCTSTDRAQQAVQFFRDSGFTLDQVRKTILKDPSVLVRTVDGQLKPKIDLLKTLGLTEQDVGFVISHQPRILCGSLDKNLSPKIFLLLNLFGSKDNLYKALKRTPGILVYDFQTLEKKLKIMESIGLLEHQIKEILEKDPRFLCLSRDKIEKNMNFLTNTAGLHSSIVVKYPLLLGFSVEKRLKPRYK
ncbi:hypothetical protein KI387_040830, partial [Taxus chinensis]